ncbi:eukaryotic translation initiation factor 4 gamma 3 isoform X3 [Electrophorus electricus]|uniref:eukaryotic translation initiation factor 4 gamma 3 isoform X3 n=1 Tax=Electrophorus electricus TaxID=8005 RepID=UPI0015D08FF1|nr:eukaryotic translation initiation factor 4 gamma 3 isoform X3 [Electrophorus electricus]
MSLPPKVVPKPAAGAVGGPLPGPSPSSQLRATLTSVSLPPGAPAAPQPPAVPPHQIPRVPLSLEERIFPPQPGVTAVYSVPRHPGPHYPGHDLSKSHPSLAGAGPGPVHAPSSALSQVSAPQAPPYRYFKGWEAGAGPAYGPSQSAGSAPLMYSPQTQPVNMQPPSRPFVTASRPAHHQFLHRTQMQAVRPSLAASSPSLRAGSQAAAAAAAVYSSSQHIMMTVSPVPFPSPQTAQYYIPQYRPSAPYVGPPQQYSVPPPASGNFYPGPGPGEYPAPYAAGPAYFSGQTVYPSSTPIIVPTAPQLPPPTKREKKPIRIRDPNQGGKDITEEIMSGSGHATPPVGCPSSTPTPPQQRSASQTPEQSAYSADPPYRLSPGAADCKPTAEDKPRAVSGPHKSSSSSSGLRPPQPCTNQKDTPSLPLLNSPSFPDPEVSGAPSSAPLPLGSCKPTAAGEPEEIQSCAVLARCPPALPDDPLPGSCPSPPASPSPPLKVVNGLAESPAPSPGHDQELRLQETPTPPLPQLTLSSLLTEEPRTPPPPPPTDEIPEERPASPPATPNTSLPSAAALASPPGLAVVLPPLASETNEASKTSDNHSVHLRAETASQGSGRASDAQAHSRKIPPAVQAVSATPKGFKRPNEGSVTLEPSQEEKEEAPSRDGSAREVSRSASEARNGPSPAPALLEKPSVPAENGETASDLLRNGDEPERPEGGVTPGERRGSTASPPPLLLVSDALLQTNGKRQYDRDFLLGFQFTPACVQKPEGLPQISDVVLDKINQTKVPTRAADSRLISRGPDFTPAFADFTRQIPGGRGTALLCLSNRRPPPRKIITNVSVNDDVQLKKAENAWKPGGKREGLAEDPDTQKTQELFRKVRSILNKLTPQMFTQLMKQVAELTVDTEERLKGVIDLVFEKAIDEPSFCLAYANMCHCLATLKVPMADKPSTTVNFRKLLLNRCQKEFERDKMDDAAFERKQKELDSAASGSERERLQEELEEQKDRARRRSTGNIKFIGELFKLRMLTEPIMHDCVVKLLKHHEDESLECLCRLLTTIGKDLDFEKAKPRMDQYFNQMEKIVKERKTSSRIRFLLQDVIDLRLHNWVSRRADQGPKTIEQIHEQAKLEEQEEQRKVHQQLLSKDNKRRPERRDPHGARDETWNTVPVTNNRRAIDPTKIPKISKPQLDEKIQLGPRAQLNWVKGSSGGAKASDPDLSRSSSNSLNRFSPLQSTSTPTALPAPPTPDPDSRPLLASRGHTGRERSDRPLSSGPSRPAPLSHGGGGNRELAEGMVAEETHEDALSIPHKANVSGDRSREAIKTESPVTVAPVKPVLSEEELEKKSKSIIDEFLHISDYKEAVQCVEELEQASQLAVFVRVGVESTLERSHMAREYMGQLLYQLTQKGSLPREQLYAGFAETLEMAEDMSIDVPHIWLYLAEVLCPLLREGGIPLKELFSELSKPLLPVGRAGILFSEILHLLCKQMSHRRVGGLWREAGLNWNDFLSEDQELQSFISEQKLQFTLSDVCSASSKTRLSPDELHLQLEHLLLEDMASDEQIFDWVEANLDASQMSSTAFLRAITTAVCKAAVKDENTSCRVDTGAIRKRLPVLHKYLNSDTERQLQALYALQALIVALNQPPNLLRMFFDCLYDEDVISEDAFYQWESSTDPAEQQGKTPALNSVMAFFTWLREADEESEDN